MNTTSYLIINVLFGECIINVHSFIHTFRVVEFIFVQRRVTCIQGILNLDFKILQQNIKSSNTFFNNCFNFFILLGILLNNI